MSATKPGEVLAETKPETIGVSGSMRLTQGMQPDRATKHALHAQESEKPLLSMEESKHKNIINCGYMGTHFHGYPSQHVVRPTFRSMIKRHEGRSKQTNLLSFFN